MTLLLIFLLGAMAVSFLCSLLESVLMSTPISYISMKEDEGDRDAIRFAKLKDNPDRPLTAILALNTIANTIGAAGVGQQATLVFGSQWFGLVSALMTLLILIFSEIVPKTIGSYHWKNLLWLSRIMNALVFILYPLVWLVEKIRRPLAGDEPDTGVPWPETSRTPVSPARKCPRWRTSARRKASSTIPRTRSSRTSSSWMTSRLTTS